MDINTHFQALRSKLSEKRTDLTDTDKIIDDLCSYYIQASEEQRTHIRKLFKDSDVGSYLIGYALRKADKIRKQSDQWFGQKLSGNSAVSS